VVWHDADTYPCAYPMFWNNPGCEKNGTIKIDSYDVYCQVQAGDYSESTTFHTYKNNWWSLLKTKDNKLVWVSNLNIKGPAVLDGVDQGSDACHKNAPAGYPDWHAH
jgi:hypothetical protein